MTNNVIKTDSLSNGDITNYFSWVSSSVMQSTNNIRRNQRNDFNLSSLPNGFEIVTNQDSSHSNTKNSHKINPNVIIKNDVEKSYEELASLASSVVMKLSIILDTLTARIMKLSSDSQRRIEPTPFYSRWDTTDRRADSAVAPVTHEISPDHRF